MQELTNTDPYEVDPHTGAPIDLWPTARVAAVLGEDDDRPLTVEEQQVADWLRAGLAVESLSTGPRFAHQPVMRWPAQSPPAPVLPLPVLPNGHIPVAYTRPKPLPVPDGSDLPPGVVSGLIPLSTGEGQ